MTERRHAVFASGLALMLFVRLSVADVEPKALKVDPEKFGLKMELVETEEQAVLVSIGELQKAGIPKKAKQWFKRAIKSDRKGALVQAIEEATLATKIAPDFFQAHAALAVGYLKKGNLREAERHLAISSQLNPYYLPAREIQGIISFKRGQVGQAGDLLRDVVRQAPTRKMAHYYLGLTLVESGDQERAQQHFGRAEALRRRPSRLSRDVADALYEHTIDLWSESP